MFEKADLLDQSLVLSLLFVLSCTYLFLLSFYLVLLYYLSMLHYLTLCDQSVCFFVCFCSCLFSFFCTVIHIYTYKYMYGYLDTKIMLSILYILVINKNLFGNVCILILLSLRHPPERVQQKLEAQEKETI